MRVNFKATLLFMSIALSIAYSQNANIDVATSGKGQLVPNADNTKLFSLTNITAHKTDSVKNEFNKKYSIYKSNQKIGQIVRVHSPIIRKRVDELGESEQYRKGLCKRPNRANPEADSILDLSDLVGKKLLIRIKAVDSSFNNLYRFSGYIENREGTTWACFTIDNKGRLVGEVDGFEGKVTNFETVEDSMVVGISIPYGMPGKKY